MSRPSFEELYAAVCARSPEYDGLYFQAVKTTKIFCRPICPARTPYAQNVEFFASAKEALEAGYRPCKRCRPLDMGAEPPAWIETLRSRIDAAPHVRLKDQDLRDLGLEPATVRRTFLKRFGMTFHAYQRARRMGMALSEIRNGAHPVEAAIQTGYNSDSGFRDAFQRILGAIPSKADGLTPAQTKWIETPLGPMIAIATDAGLVLLEFVDRRMLETQLRTLSTRLRCRVVPGEHKFLDQTAAELGAYFAGELRQFSVPLVIDGTPFQEAVWRALLTIPCGQTTSYAELAAKIENPGAIRAVGTANGDNRIAILIPCHRVIRTDGTLGGYGGGLWRKQRLLEIEGAAAAERKQECLAL